MARRKNTRFIDPRYFMDEKMERLDENERGFDLAGALGGAKEMEDAKRGTDIQVAQHKALKPAVGTDDVPGALDKLLGYVEILQRAPYKSRFSSATTLLDLLMSEAGTSMVNKDNIESMIAIVRNVSKGSLNFKHSDPAAQKLYHLKEGRSEAFNTAVEIGGLKRLAQSGYFLKAAGLSEGDNEQLFQIISDLHTIAAKLGSQPPRGDIGYALPGVLGK